MQLKITETDLAEIGRVWRAKGLWVGVKSFCVNQQQRQHFYGEKPERKPEGPVKMMGYL